MKLENARILLTGATGGLGRELARQLAASGAAVLLAGRDAARLEALRASLGARASLVVADLTRAEGVALMTRAAQDFGVNVLINNAGTSAFGMLENQPWPTIEEVLATSLEAPIHLTPCCPGSRPSRRQPSSTWAQPLAVFRSPVLPPTRQPRPGCARSRRRCGGSWPIRWLRWCTSCRAPSIPR